MASDEFNFIDLAFSNYWTSLACTERDLIMNIPYPRNDLQNGLGYEDWTWNIEIIKAGYIHKVIPKTGHAIRRKSGELSLLRQSNRVGAIPLPTHAFRTMLSPD